MNPWNRKILLLILLLSSCKYEDGPIFSFTSPENRIEGNWTIDCVQENGIDQMPRIDSLNISYYNFGGPLDVDPNTNSFKVLISNNIFYNSTWHFVGNDEKQLYVGTFGCGSQPPDIIPSFQPLPGFRGSCDWDSIIFWNITKLTKNKLWLEAQINGYDYTVHLKQL